MPGCAGRVAHAQGYALVERPDTGTDEEHTIFRVVNNVGNDLTAPLTMLSPRPHLALIKM